MIEEAFDTVLENREEGNIGRTQDGVAIIWTDKETGLTRSVHGFESETGVTVEYTVWKEQNNTRHWVRREFATLHESTLDALVELVELVVQRVGRVTEDDLTESETTRQAA